MSSIVSIYELTDSDLLAVVKRISQDLTDVKLDDIKVQHDGGEDGAGYIVEVRNFGVYDMLFTGREVIYIYYPNETFETYRAAYVDSDEVVIPYINIKIAILKARELEK